MQLCHSCSNDKNNSACISGLMAVSSDWCNVKDSFGPANLAFYCLSHNSAPRFKLYSERTLKHVLGFESEKQRHDLYVPFVTNF